MAQSIDWNGTNLTLKPPAGVSEAQCRSIKVFFNGSCFVSCWEFSQEEIDEIVKTGKIFVSLWGGPPPIAIGNEAAIHELVADYDSVWKKSV